LNDDHVDLSDPDAVLIQYDKLVKKLALKYRGPDYPFDDLCQVGMMALIKAAPKYDVSKGGKLGFFFSWVRFDILNYKRDHNLIKIPREMTWDVEMRPKVVSIFHDKDDDLPEYPYRYDVEVEFPYEEVEESFALQGILTAMESVLTPIESRIMRLYYLQEIPQRGIGVAVGRCQMEVSRIIHRSISKLRDHYFDLEVQTAPRSLVA